MLDRRDGGRAPIHTMATRSHYCHLVTQSHTIATWSQYGHLVTLLPPGHTMATWSHCCHLVTLWPPGHTMDTWCHHSWTHFHAPLFFRCRPRLAFLDEATSALDGSTEAKLYGQLKARWGGGGGGYRQLKARWGVEGYRGSSNPGGGGWRCGGGLN